MSRDSLFMMFEAQGYTAGGVRDVFGAGSTLASGEVCYDGGYREGTVEQIFGDGSVPGSYEAVAMLEPTLISGWLFQLLVVISLVAYIYMLLRSWNFIGSIWMGLFIRRSERRMRDEGGEIPLERFKFSAMVLGMVLMALVVVRFVDLSSQADASVYEHDTAVVMPIYALFVTSAFFVWNYVLHKLVGLITNSAVMSDAVSVSMMNFVRCIVVVSPLVLVWLLSPLDMLHTWSVVLGVVMSIMLIIYLKDTFQLFVSKKIPILNWILYLCTALLLPISFMSRIIPQLFG